MTLSIDQYRNYIIEKRKFTQNPSDYRMEISGGPDGTFICYPDSFLLPGRNFINTPFSYAGAEFTFPLRKEYNELSVNFIVYQDWKERIYFEKWSDSILPSKDKSESPPPAVYDSIPAYFSDKEFLRNIKIQFKERSSTGLSKKSLTYNFTFCYPLLITPTNFSSDNSGYTVFTVNFAILDYYISEINYQNNESVTSNINDNL